MEPCLQPKQRSDAKHQNMFGYSSKTRNEHQAKHSNLAYSKQEVKAKQVKDWNPVCREQEADANHQK